MSESLGEREIRILSCFLFLLENTVMKKEPFSPLWLSKCKFSLLALSFCEQVVLVLRLHRVMET